MTNKVYEFAKKMVPDEINALAGFTTGLETGLLIAKNRPFVGEELLQILLDDFGGTADMDDIDEALGLN